MDNSNWQLKSSNFYSTDWLVIRAIEKKVFYSIIFLQFYIYNIRYIFNSKLITIYILSRSIISANIVLPIYKKYLILYSIFTATNYQNFRITDNLIETRQDIFGSEILKY